MLQFIKSLAIAMLHQEVLYGYYSLHSYRSTVPGLIPEDYKCSYSYLLTQLI